MKNNKKIEEDDIEFLIDLLFDSDLTLNQIAKELDINIAVLNKKINSLGLNWLKTSRRKMSRGQTALTLMLKKLIPGEKIINEYHIGEKLKLDIYCPAYKLAVEFHGRQHFYYTGRFFDSKYEFEEAQKRDIKKTEWCKENDIALVVFRYNDSLNELDVCNRLLEAIRESPKIESPKKEKKTITSNEFYKTMKKKNSEYKKSLYRKHKGN